VSPWLFVGIVFLVLAVVVAVNALRRPPT